MRKRFALSMLLTFTMLIAVLGFSVPVTVMAAGPGVAVLWGKNEQGQIGDNTQTDRPLATKPIIVPATVVEIAAATAGNHSLVLLSDGTVMSFGENQVGNLGRGPGQIGGFRAAPDFVVGTDGTGKLSNIKTIGKNTGGGHSLAVGNDGKVYVWGDNSTGQQGQGDVGGSPNPVPKTVKTSTGQNQPLVDLTNIKTVAGGGGFSLALTNDGRVYAWGINFAGSLGQGAAADGIIPVAVPVKNEAGNGLLGTGGGPIVTGIAAGGQHALAMMSDGTLRAWGYNQFGQLGDGFAGNGSCCNVAFLPLLVTGVDGLKFIDIAGGDNHSVLLQDNGQVWALGRNTAGQLGQGDFTGGPHPVPLKVKNADGTGTLTGVKAVASGGSNCTMALMNDGTVMAMGENTNGQLGIGTSDGNTHPLPLAVKNLVGVQLISMSVSHTMALASGYTLAVSTAGVSANPGSGAATPATAAYPAGTTANITATPDAGSIFVGWTLDGVDAGWAVPKPVLMDRPHSLVANFVKAPAFTDVPQKPSLPKSDPAYPTTYAAITQLAARGVIRGYNDGSNTFGTFDPILRSQQAALIGRPLYGEENAISPFSDKCLLNDPTNCVDDELWRYAAVLNAHSIALGYNDAATCRPYAIPCYDPRANVSFAQGISFITRTMIDKGYWTRQPIDPNLYGGVLNGTGHEQDFATYVHYVAAPPDFPVGGSFSKADLTADGTRGWFAKALWKALDGYFGPAPAP
jgi:alpha-tubulin suppressor-like RCC1 family protein